MYSQEVTFKSLKPTILGTGLQQAEFGWSIRDDMLDMSAKRLIAIIGVPKGASQLELQMVITMKTKGQYLGFIQGDVATGETKSLKIDLRQLCRGYRPAPPLDLVEVTPVGVERIVGSLAPVRCASREVINPT